VHTNRSLSCHSVKRSSWIPVPVNHLKAQENPPLVCVLAPCVIPGTNVSLRRLLRTEFAVHWTLNPITLKPGRQGCYSPLGHAHTKWRGTTAASRSQECTILFPSPTYTTLAPSSPPVTSWMVRASAIICQKEETSVRACSFVREGIRHKLSMRGGVNQSSPVCMGRTSAVVKEERKAQSEAACF
jgi:hypothetical protein